MSYVMVAIGGMNAVQQVQAGRFAKKQAELSAQGADYQAMVEQTRALETARIIRRAGAAQLAQTTAAYAGAGVVVGEGSAGEAERYVQQAVEQDAFQALLEGGRRARGMQTDAQMLRIDGQMKQSASNMLAVNSVLNSGAGALKSSGWRTQGPGFSGTQAPAPVETRTIPRG